MSPQDEYALLTRALRGDAPAIRQLSDLLRLPTRIAVADALWQRDPSAAPDGAHREVNELTRSVLDALLSKKGKMLRSWNPARGGSLQSHVERVARPIVESLLSEQEIRVSA